MLLRNVRDAGRVLLGLSNSSQTAYRHPVRISPHAFRCDLCGEGASITGPGDRVFMKHQCEGHDMFEDFPGATRYVGLREHGKRVWAAVKRDMPRRVSGHPTERPVMNLGQVRSVSIDINARDIPQATLDLIYGGNAPKIGKQPSTHITPEEGRANLEKHFARETELKSSRPQDDPYVAVDILEKNLAREEVEVTVQPDFSGFARFADESRPEAPDYPTFGPWSGYEAMGQELDTEHIDRAYASGFEYKPTYQMAEEGTDKREAN